MPVMFTYIRVYESINYQDIQMLAQPQINLNLTKTDFASPQPWEELPLNPDMEKGVDTRTLSAEIFENCGFFFIVEDFAPLFQKKTYFLWKYLMKHLIFGIFIAYKWWYPQ